MLFRSVDSSVVIVESGEIITGPVVVIGSSGETMVGFEESIAGSAINTEVFVIAGDSGKIYSGSCSISASGGFSKGSLTYKNLCLVRFTAFGFNSSKVPILAVQPEFSCMYLD